MITEAQQARMDVIKKERLFVYGESVTEFEDGAVAFSHYSMPGSCGFLTHHVIAADGELVQLTDAGVQSFGAIMDRVGGGGLRYA